MRRYRLDQLLETRHLKHASVLHILLQIFRLFADRLALLLNRRDILQLIFFIRQRIRFLLYLKYAIHYYISIILIRLGLILCTIMQIIITNLNDESTPN